METLAILEILGRQGEVIRSERLAQFPVTLGRAYDNDVIINDPYLAAHHIRIESDEKGFKAIDLGSGSGMHRTGVKAHQNEILLDGDTVLRLGHTQLRLRDRNYVVPPEQISSPDRSFRHPWMFGLALVALVAFFWLETYLFSVSTAQEFKAVGAPRVMLVAKLLVWVAICSGIGKLMSGKGQFFLHGAIACLGLVAWRLTEFLVSLGAFAFSWPALEQYSSLVLGLVLGGVIYRHISLVARTHRGSRVMVSLLLALVLSIGYWAYSRPAEKEGWGVAEHHVKLWPGVTLVAAGIPVDAFFAKTEALRREVEAKRNDD